MKTKSPYKDNKEFEKDLKNFANKFRVTIAEHSLKTSGYFEISCYNLILRYYEKKGYTLEVMNVQSDGFKFKCGPHGYISNFSYFKATKTDGDGQEESVYILHNATVQSAFDDKVFTTPDIVIAKTDVADETTDYYITKHKLTYIGKENLVSFCEAKHLTPFPELMINFMGIVHELKPECMRDEVAKVASGHIAPSLMISGTFGKPTKRIQESLEKRYYVNFLDNLFDDSSVGAFSSKSKVNKMATLSKKSEWEPMYENTYSIPEEFADVKETI